MRRVLAAVLVPALLAACATPAPAPAPASAGAYVFAYFTRNGEDGLHLAASSDGYHWDKLNGGASYLRPTVGVSKLMRDPCIVRGPDGTYHMVWTAGWNENGIGYASSKDLIHWSAQRYLPVMASEPGTLNAWAPEIAWDDKRGEFLIFWSSTVPGKFAAGEGQGDGKYNHRIYATTTRDFASFTPTRLFYDPGFSVIDATFLRTQDRDWLLVKDETRNPPKKYLQLASAASIQGPFGKLSAPITPPGLWTEGPTALQVGADTILYYDAYTAKHYGALRARGGDLTKWEDVTAQMSFPDEGTPVRMRHGTAIAVPAADLAALRAAGSFDIAITVDDLPAHGPLPAGTTRLAIAESYMATLRAHHVPEAFGFVNAARLKDNPDGGAVLEAWRKAGYPLGNHAYTHMNLARAPSLEAWQADVIAGEAGVAARMQGQDWHWFRFPNLSAGGERGPGALAFLRARGYKVADVSVAFGDWDYTDAYARCVAKGDQASIDAMKRHYYHRVDLGIASMKAQSTQVFGRVIPQVLLTHLGGWSAVTLPEVMARLDAAGARYVTLAQAQSDPAYAQPGGGSLIARAAKKAGVSLVAEGGKDAGPELDIKALCH